jgi:hypothetical protein
MIARIPGILAAAVPLLCFGATEDFQPMHMAQIDSARVNFRVGMTPARAAHYYPRNDVRALADWLRGHVQPGDVVITGIANLAQYYSGFDYFFLDEQDPRYDAYVCQNGRTERWTNHIVLYGGRALRPILVPGRRVLASVYPDTEARLRTAAASAGWRISPLWQTESGQPDVVLIEREPGVTDTQ